MRKSVIYFGCIMLLSVALATSCSKKVDTDKNTDNITIVPEVTPSVTPVIDSTVEITPTEAIKDETKYINEKEATKLIVDTILDRGYFVQYDGDVTIGDNVYYEFLIYNGEDIIKPSVIVNKVTSELLCYNEDKTTSPLNTHPLLSSVNETREQDNEDKTVENKFTEEDAYKKLSTVSKEVLGLPVELSEYTIIYDDYNSMISEQECYGINVFAKVEDKMISMGVYYVAIDDSAMYKFDVEADDFVEIK